jgi:hypothetical protein
MAPSLATRAERIMVGAAGPTIPTDVRATQHGLLLAVLAALGGVGCGSRTDPGAARTNSVPCCAPDAAPADGSSLADASSGDGEAPLDATPGMDSSGGCDDGGLPELVYALDDVGVLHRYDPLTGRTTDLGAPGCSDGNVQWTFTASRDRGYIIYTDGSLYTVDLATLACAPTAFRPGQLGLDTESGIAAVGSGASERLYFYGIPNGSSTPILAVSDTTSFVLTKVGDILPNPPASSYRVNLTSDFMGRLYAFSPLGLVQEIDSASGTVLRAVDTGVTSMGTWATITYGSDLYLWVQSDVVGYDLASRLRTSDRDAGANAIGAGSFTVCGGP